MRQATSCSRGGSSRAAGALEGACRCVALCDCAAVAGAQIMFVLFAVVAALWGALLLRQRAHAHRLHALMAVLVLFKALTVGP